MQAFVPSRSALRVALRRAAHQLYDEPPLVFEDPLAVRILGPHAAELRRTPGRGLGRRPGIRARTHSFSLRAFLVARSRYAEDQLGAACARGVRQYVLLGAGLDTFAYRNPHAELRVIEADHPATQAWKRELLANAGIAVPARVSYAPLDLESDDIGCALHSSGFEPRRRAFVACLGVLPYLSQAAFERVLNFLAAQPADSEAVFDYTQPRDEHSGFDQLAHDSMTARLRASGEPFRVHWTPQELHGRIAELGLTVVEDLGAAELNRRYFEDRSDGLAVLPSAGRLVTVQVTTGSEASRRGAGPPGASIL